MARSVARAFFPVLAALLLQLPALAQESDTAAPPRKPARPYWSTGSDAFIFSSAYVRDGLGNDGLSTLRFSYILNMGVHYNYDFSRSAGIFTGIGIKNIGFIDKVDDSTIKRRVYTIGVPLGIKIGNMPARSYVFFGGGIDVPFNYREKGFRKRGDKEKFNEWFSDRTPRVMPYFFAGFTLLPSLMSVKAQYYPGNFMNEDFVEDREGPGKGLKVYNGYKANLFYISLGLDIKYRNRKKMNAEE